MLSASENIRTEFGGLIETKMWLRIYWQKLS